MLDKDKIQLIESSKLGSFNTADSTARAPASQIDSCVANKNKGRRELVSEGIDIIVSLFAAVGQQRLFTRTIMTKRTKGRVVVYDKDEIMHYFETCNYEDCRINAYPTFSKAEEHNYKKGTNLDFFAPTILFIDLDAKRFSSEGFET